MRATRIAIALALLALFGAAGSASAFTLPFAAPNENETATYFATDEPLLPSDTDGSADIYRRAGGVLSLETLGDPSCQPGCGNGAFDVETPFGVLPVGENGLLFQTAEQLVPADQDSSVDLYERSGNTLSLISQGPKNFNGEFEPELDTWSLDGSRVVFTTAEQVASPDTDSSIDLYERNLAAGTTTLVSQGQINGNGAFDAQFAGSSFDLSRIFFTTAEKLVPADTDESVDLYERHEGTTTLVSQGQINGNGAFNVASLVLASAKGDRVFFSTEEALVSADTDAASDIYERHEGTTTLVSQGEINGNGLFPAQVRRASEDGTRFFFITAEKLVAADTDESNDLYERHEGTTTLVSRGEINGNGAFPVVFRRASTDGTRVFFTTAEKLVSADTDEAVDLYERHGGVTTLVSQGPGEFNSSHVPNPNQISGDGTQVFLTSADKLVAADTDESLDVYERSAGTTTLVSQGQINGNGAFDVTSGGGVTHPVFITSEQLVPGDTDTEPDVYERFAGRTRLVSTAKPAPAAPTFAESSPPSGSNANSPAIRGSAEAESTVAVFSTPGCTGAPLAEGTVAQFANPGLTVSVPDNSSTAFYAEATDIDENTGTCTQAPFTYVEDSLALPPTLAGVSPPGPANDNGPRVRGNAERNSVVQLFTNSLCVGTPAAIGSTVDFEGAGVALPVPDNFTTTVYGRITDAAGNVSACSTSSVTYVEDSQAPETKITGGARGRTHDNTPTIRFSANEPATFRCAIDGKAAKRCASPFTTPKLKPGRHRIAVTATDLAGNADQTPAVRVVKVLAKPHKKSAR